MPGKCVNGVHQHREATPIGNGKQKTSYQVQLNRVKQNKDFPEDREPWNPVVLSSHLLNICILFSVEKIRVSGLRHCYSALKTAGAFVAGFGSTNYKMKKTSLFYMVKQSPGSWVQKEVRNVWATELHTPCWLFSGWMKSSKVNTLMSYCCILNFPTVTRKTTYSVHCFSLYHGAIATTHPASTSAVPFQNAIPFEEKNC